jgi:hypothetical protein
MHGLHEVTESDGFEQALPGLLVRMLGERL